jgi:signal transduction histidine kinase
MKNDFSNLEKKSRVFSVQAFLSVFLILLLIGSIPGLFYGHSFSLQVALKNAGWYFIYWFIVALAFSLTTTYQKYKSYDKPIAELSEATKKVAGGDFSVYVDPNQTTHKNPYFSRMITDFNAMVQELGSVETMKTDFVSSVSHELKTPLAVIQNYATLLKDDLLTEANKQIYLDEIIHASNDLAVTVSNILLLNKLDNQGMVKKNNPFNLVEQLSDMVISFESLIEEKNLDLTVEIEDRAMIDLDQNMLGIVWRNLLSNAIKFSDDFGQIELKQWSTEHALFVQVKDFGIGMDKQTLNHLFEKFYQADTSRSQQGNGLGLALVIRVLDLIGGTITCQSTLGEGSAFIVCLPLQ